MRLTILSAKWRPFCPGEDEFTTEWIKPISFRNGLVSHENSTWEDTLSRFTKFISFTLGGPMTVLPRVSLPTLNPLSTMASWHWNALGMTERGIHRSQDRRIPLTTGRWCRALVLCCYVEQAIEQTGELVRRHNADVTAMQSVSFPVSPSVSLSVYLHLL